jgi:VWFA-related protein
MRQSTGLSMGRAALAAITVTAGLGICPRVSAQLSVSSNLVQVGVVVSNGKGPVLGLKSDDFVVLDEGKPRKISVFLAESESAALQPKTAAPPVVLAKNTFSNAVPDEGAAAQGPILTTGTPTIILLDSLNTLSGSMQGAFEGQPMWVEDHALANVKQRLVAVLKAMDPHRPIAVYGLGLQLKMLCDFTCNRDELLAAVKHYDPTSKTTRESVAPGGMEVTGADGLHMGGGLGSAWAEGDRDLAAKNNGSRAQDTMAALVTIAGRVSNIPGRKNLIWLTGNLPFSGEVIARIVTPAKIAIYPMDTRGLQTWQFNSVISGTDMTLAATAKLKAMGATISGSQPTGIESMLEMAADTGGIAFVNTNDIGGAVRSVVDGPSVTYTLGFYINDESVDSKFHELKIEVNGADVQLRYPRGYFALPNQGAKQAEAAGQQRLLTAAIRSPFEALAVPLDVKLERAGQPAADSLRVEGTVGVQGLSLPQDGGVRHGTIEVYTIEQDATGKVLKHTTNQMKLDLTAQQFDDYAKSGIQFGEVIQPQAETATLRVIVRDAATARLGSVIIPLAKVQ